MDYRLDVSRCQGGPSDKLPFRRLDVPPDLAGLFSDHTVAYVFKEFSVNRSACLLVF